MVTMIWSLIVSLYGLGAFFGSLSISSVSRMLGRCVKKTPKQTQRLRTLGVVVQIGCCCSVLRKRAAVCSSCIAVAAGAIMLASKAAGSYEMIIAARILYGFSAGKIVWRGRWCHRALFVWLDYVIGRRSGTGHPPGISDRDLTHKHKRDSLSERQHVPVSWQTVCSVHWTEVSGPGGPQSSCMWQFSFIERECTFLLFLPVRSWGERICGTSFSVFPHSSLWFRFWCCHFSRMLPDICSLRKATKRPAKKVGWESHYCKPSVNGAQKQLCWSPKA